MLLVAPALPHCMEFRLTLTVLPVYHLLLVSSAYFLLGGLQTSSLKILDAMVGHAVGVMLGHN